MDALRPSPAPTILGIPLGTPLQRGRPRPPKRGPLPESIVRLQRALGKLDPRARELVTMRHVEGLDFVNIQARTGLPLSDIESIYIQAMRTLWRSTEDASTPRLP